MDIVVGIQINQIYIRSIDSKNYQLQIRCQKTEFANINELMYNWDENKIIGTPIIREPITKVVQEIEINKSGTTLAF